MPQLFFIGIGSLSSSRVLEHLSKGGLQALGALFANGGGVPLRFDPPWLESALWETVATGTSTHEHRVWSHSSRVYSSAPAPRRFWSAFRDLGWHTSLIGWPGPPPNTPEADFTATHDFLSNSSLSAGRFNGCILAADQLHDEVLDALAANWRTASPDQIPKLQVLRRHLAKLYSAHRVAREILSTPNVHGAKQIVVLHLDFLTHVEALFGAYSGRRSPKVDLHDWSLFAGLPERALGLVDLLIGDLLKTTEPGARIVVATSPARENHPWREHRGFCLPGHSTGTPQDEELTAQDVIRKLFPGLPKTSDSHPSQLPEPHGLTAWESFHGGVALAAAGQWSHSLPWLHHAWRNAPENRLFAMEFSRAGQRVGDTEIAGLAAEAVWDQGGFTEEERRLGSINIRPSDNTPAFFLKTAGPAEIERLFLLSGSPGTGFSKCWVLIAPGETDRITGGAVLQHGGRIRLYLAPRWRKCRTAASTLLAGVVEDFTRHEGAANCRVEIYNSTELAETLSELGLHEVRTDERWRIPFAPLLARVVASWDKIKNRAADRYRVLQAMPNAAVLQQAMSIAKAHGLANPRLVEWLACPDAASKFHRPTCNYVMDGESLAALVLSRSLSPSRIFVELRAVDPAYMHDSRCLNILAMMRPLSMGLQQGIESLELLGRRVEEAETLSMARRSQGTCLETRHVFDIHPTFPLLSTNNSARPSNPYLAHIP